MGRTTDYIVTIVYEKDINIFPKDRKIERTEWKALSGMYKGQYHRDDDLPAIIHSNGTNEWWFNGVRHRENNMPAIMDKYGRTKYYYQGRLHRTNGPAVIFNNGQEEYWINGEKVRNKKEFSMDEVAKALGVPVDELRIKKD